ncbi:rhodanese-like domain-containing protein [Cellulosimicrobium aquatile]|uniref:rhodanese-like domain-containing protein n=1 Tax=Cellulosimicrobium aquatile TaxID=1612203 RepID=UPI001459F142|nr:rhodanese-like domain-containing protein [Cellulosimicrobium aquatile]NMF27794.1 rhodanese-like domain-containing protein [Cellulosimicrobium aquatile]
MSDQSQQASAPWPAPPEARPAVGYAGDLTPQQAWDLLAHDERAVLVDVRTEGEWRTIGVPDATQLGRDVLFDEWVTPAGPNPRFLDRLVEAGLTPGDERPVVFLCRSGQRSIGAARAATAAGLGPSYNVLEGFEGAQGFSGLRDVEGWKVHGLPTTTFDEAAR